MSRLTLAVLAQSFVVAIAIVLSNSEHGSAEDTAASFKKNKNFVSCLLGANSCRLDSLSVSDLSKVEAIWNLQKCRFGAPSCNKQALASDDLLKVEQAARTIADEVGQRDLDQKPNTDRQTVAGRKKAEAALKDLAAARQEIASLKARLADAAVAHREDQEVARDANERLAMLDQKRARTDAATKERDAARGEIESLKRRANDLAAAQIDAAEVAKRAESARQAFVQERERAEGLAADLAAVRHEVEAMKGHAIESTADPYRTCEAVPETGQQAAAEREHAKPEELMTAQAQKARAETNISSARQEQPSAPLASNEIGGEAATISVERANQSTTLPYASTASPNSSQPAEARSPAPTSSVPTATSPDEERFLQRAEVLINRGDISAARVMLEHALDLGSQRAARRLAETYDPDVLTSWGARGTRGDRRRAQELYRRAHEGGIGAPPAMLETPEQANMGSR